MRETITGLLTGFIFGLGLCLSRMTDPAVVQGFLDIAGAWDPTLLFVMGGGVAVAFVGYRYVLQRKQPLWAPKFPSPPAGHDRCAASFRRRDLRCRLGPFGLLSGAGGRLARLGPQDGPSVRRGDGRRHDRGPMDAHQRLR